MFHAMRWIIRDNVLLVLLLLGTAFSGGAGQTAAQVPAVDVATLEGTAYRLVDQTIVDGVVIDETEAPITDGRIAIPELGIDMPLAADGTFGLSDLPVNADPGSPTEVTVIFTAPGLGSFTYLHLRIGPGRGPILTPVLIDTPRVDDHSLDRRGSDIIGESQPSLSLAGSSLDDAAQDPDGGPASGEGCQPSREILGLPPTIRVWENRFGQDQQVHTVDFKFYVKHVLPREWDASWNDQSLLAGAMAVKSYAWWHATHVYPAHQHITKGPACYDVDAVAHQVFDPMDSAPETNAAVDATWDFYMIEGSGLQSDVVQAFYKAGFKNPPPPQVPLDWDACGEWYNVTPPAGNDMSQWGSQSCAQGGMPWYQILTTYYFPPLVSWVLLAASGDNDSDGCSNGREVGNNQYLGGKRNLLYFWDFYDVWTQVSPGVWTRDKAVNVVGDILGVARRFGWLRPAGMPSKQVALTEALTPPTSPTGYHADYDRGPLNGPNRWNRNPPDGAINVLNDVLGVASQFGTTCAPSP